MASSINAFIAGQADAAARPIQEAAASPVVAAQSAAAAKPAVMSAPPNYQQQLLDYVAQKRAAFQPAALTFSDLKDGAQPEQPDDWSYADEWASSLKDPVAKQAYDAMVASRKNTRDFRETGRLGGFDASDFSDQLRNQWTERVYSGGADGLDLSTADDRTRNAFKLREQLIAANDPYVKAGKFSMENKAGGANQHYGSLAMQLADRGVTDLGQLKWNNGHFEVNGKDIGALEDARGSGYTYYDTYNVNGKPVIVPRWEDSSDNKKIAAGLALGAMFIPGLNAAVGGALGASGTTASVIGGGLINGSLSALSGGDFLKGALVGGITAGMPNVAGAAGVTNKIGAGLINGAVKGGLSSAINGTSITKGALAGAAGGGIEALNPAGALGITNGTASGAINGALKGGAGALIKGGSVKDGLVSGAISGGVKGFNPAASLGVDNTAAQGLINKVISLKLQGKKLPPAQQLVLNALVQDALKKRKKG